MPDDILLRLAAKMIAHYRFDCIIVLEFQTAVLLLRIDDIVSGTKKQMDSGGSSMPAAPQASEGPEA